MTPKTAPTAPTLEELLLYAPVPGLLKDRIILVTGAAEGIGRAVALACARNGASTVLLDVNEAGLEALRADMTAESLSPPELVLMDLATATVADYRKLAETLGERYGRLDGLVNNAGWIGALTPFEHVNPQDWSRAVTVNLLAPFFLTQWCMRLLARSADPALVFSLHDVRRSFWGGYAVAKGGLEALMRVIADEYHPQSMHPVRVFGIDTGPVNTEARRRNYPGERPDAHPSPEDVVGPYLFALGSEARGLSGVILAAQAGETRTPG